MTGQFSLGKAGTGAMFINWLDVLAARERHKDLVRAAQAYRLTQLALAGRTTHHHFYHRALTRLGRWLVAWGGYLVEHCDVPVMETPSPPSRVERRKQA